MKQFPVVFCMLFQLLLANFAFGQMGELSVVSKEHPFVIWIDGNKVEEVYRNEVQVSYIQEDVISVRIVFESKNIKPIKSKKIVLKPSDDAQYLKVKAEIQFKKNKKKPKLVIVRMEEQPPLLQNKRNGKGGL